MSTVTVLVVIGDTVVEESFTAERVTYQHYADGRLLIKLWAGGKVAQYVSYRRAEKVHRIDADLAPREERA